MGKPIQYTLAYNFDIQLPQRINHLNDRCETSAAVTEFFGAIASDKIPNARPQARLPVISLCELKDHISELKSNNFEFNYLVNTSKKIPDSILLEFVEKLLKTGVSRMTIGVPSYASILKKYFPHLHTTLSVTYGLDTCSREWLELEGGFDAVYLKPVTANRNFKLIKQFVNRSNVDIQLYANNSCISNCPVFHDHYNLFAKQNSPSKVELVNDSFFRGCSAIKLSNPIEWLQSPWIRPEDIPDYSSEGVTKFKLSDRMCDSDTLCEIADSYLKLKSSENLFDIIERRGVKFDSLLKPRRQKSLIVHSNAIPQNFIDHFKLDECSGSSCEYCKEVADLVVDFQFDREFFAVTVSDSVIPQKLKSRIVDSVVNR